jgi:hypothetical protein
MVVDYKEDTPPDSQAGKKRKKEKKRPKPRSGKGQKKSECREQAEGSSVNVWGGLKWLVRANFHNFLW